MSDMSFDKGFLPCDIYLPARFVDPAKWAVIACDQYTSQRDYWDKVGRTVGGAPSALNVIQPEIDLDTADERRPFVRACMEKYLSEGVLEKRVSHGFVLTLRTTPSGARPGLVGAVDLEAYDFAPGNDRPVRASEGTIIERLPPRIKIRRGAALECPHIMLLADDKEGLLVESVYESVKHAAPLYDFELMLGGGHLTGWSVTDSKALTRIDRALDDLYTRGSGFLCAVGDGNHSLATAKACWDELKATLSEQERAAHPARYALCEIVNLHCPALRFEPIHRAVFGADLSTLLTSFSWYLASKGLKREAGGSIRFTNGKECACIGVSGEGSMLDTVYLQPWLDEFIAAHPGASVDYVHGEDALMRICADTGACGILLGTIDKSALFPSILAGGVLPRKSFSMGSADEKRFYMEARLIA